MKICYCLVAPGSFRKETDVQSVTDDSEDRALCILVFLTADFLLVSSLACSSIDFSLFYSVQSGSAAQSSSYPTGTGEINSPRREADLSPSSSAQNKNVVTEPLLALHMSSWHNA
jgi:hypothetical protein